MNVRRCEPNVRLHELNNDQRRGSSDLLRELSVQRDLLQRDQLRPERLRRPRRELKSHGRNHSSRDARNRPRGNSNSSGPSARNRSNGNKLLPRLRPRKAEVKAEVKNRK